MACGILVSCPGTEPGLLAARVQSPKQWTTREFPLLYCLHCCTFPECHRVEIIHYVAFDDWLNIFKNIYLFVYLTRSGLSCITQAL